jgi:hypothetical protein
MKQSSLAVGTPFPHLGFDIQSIDRRIRDLQSRRKSSRYGRQKSRLELELETSLAAFDPPKTSFSCQPDDVVRFLVWKDRKGRTKVHNGTGGKFVVADQKIAGRNKAHCIYIQNKAES